MKKPVFYGSSTAVATPFLENGEIDFESFAGLIDWQISEGTQALTILGTTGENPTVSDSEFTKMISFAVKRAAKRVPVIAGTGRNDTRHSVELSEEAQRLGADALLVVTPYYNKTTQAGLVAHTQKIADSVKLPIILYNVPSRTGMSFTAETYAELSKHPNINGVKEASGNFTLILQTLKKCPEDFYIYSGNDDQNVAIIAMGGVGAISVLGNIIPKITQENCKKALDGQIRQASRELADLCDLIDALFVETNPIPVKAALAAMGRCGKTLRLPLVDISEKNKQVLFAAMRAHGLIK